MPFVIFGFIKAFSMYGKGILRRGGLIARLFFWALISFCLIFAQQIYNFLSNNKLTNSPPLSLADVLLTTGVIFCLFLSMRAYSKIDNLENRVTDLHEKLSIELSNKNK